MINMLGLVLLTYLQQHSGILIARDNDQFAFPHRSFQEYLAMGWLTAQSGDELSQIVRTNPLWWREVVLLALLNQRKTPKFAINYIQELLENQTPPANDNQHHLLVLAGLGLVELGLTGWNNPDFQTQRNTIRHGIVSLLENPDTLNIPERAEAGRVLGDIGDPRPGTGLNADGFPDIAWKLIPAGEITLEENTGTFPVEAFHLACYPVTNAQFQAFVDDPDGYKNAQWWAGLEQPDKPESPMWNNANHPRERVSWFEAMAYCAWLSQRMNKEIRLPTEWQWQQAACSSHPDFNYPWEGNYQSGYANINETRTKTGTHYLQRTTAVGIYPQGDSQQDVSDLSGNVWEWCLNTYENPNNVSVLGDNSRVVRGGCWIFNSGYARASYRYYDHPGSRSHFIGFRLCCFSHIAPVLQWC
jgi:hypothetical protein